MALNHTQSKLVCACSDGTLKIYSIDSMEQYSDIKLFRYNIYIIYVSLIFR
jgi:hypothetical protein